MIFKPLSSKVRAFCRFSLASVIVTAVGSFPAIAAEPPIIVIDNTASENSSAVITNLATDYKTGCSKSQALGDRTCNAINVSPENFQVVQGNATDDLVAFMGVKNPESTSYDRASSDEPLDYFKNNQHLLNLQKLRATADRISTFSTGLPTGSFGTISWEQFISNVANAKTMYGIVRVKVPLQRKLPVIVKVTSTSDDDEHDDDGHDDDGHDDDERSDDGHESERSDDDGDDDEEGDDDDHETKSSIRVTYESCRSPSDPGCACAPTKKTELKPGATICEMKFGSNAQIDVRGGLFLDWVDAETGNPISLEEMPENPRDVYFKVAVPININPANARAGDQVMASIDQVANLTRNVRCGTSGECVKPVTKEIPYYLVTTESKDAFRFDTGITLTENVFRNLTRIEQYHLMFPSGYADGWALALSRLGITGATWKSFGFNVPDVSGFLTANDIRSEAFEDLPVYVYSGGFVDMHHHVNISGLVYVNQSLELEQKGLVTGGSVAVESRESDDDGDHEDDDGDDHKKGSSDHDSEHSSRDHDSDDGDDDSDHDDDSDDDKGSCGKKEKDDDDHEDDDGDHSDDDDHSSKSSTSDDDDHSSKSSSGGSEHGSDDDSDHDGDDDGHDDDEHDDDEGGSGGCESIDTIPLERDPAKQYISGAFIVRNSFYLEALYEDGVTLISNQPFSYSNIILSESSTSAGVFEPFDDSGSNNVLPVNKATEYKFARELAAKNPDTRPKVDDRTRRISPGPQWVEIRAQ